MKYFGGNINNLENILDNTINKQDTQITNVTQSIDQQQSVQQQQTQQPVQQFKLPDIINNTVNVINQQMPSTNEINSRNTTLLTYKPLQVATLSPLDLDYIKTKQPFIDNNDKLFKASTQDGLQEMSQNIPTNNPIITQTETQSMIINETSQPTTTVYPLRIEQHNVAKVNDDTTLRPIEIARNLSKNMYPKLKQPSYVGHQTSLLANSAFVLGSNETSIFPDIKEVPLNVQLNVNPYDDSEIGTISKKLDGTTVPPQDLPEPVFYNNNKLQGIKNPYQYYSQFKKIMTKESESTIKNLKNNLNNKNKNTNDNLRDVLGNSADLDFMNFKDFMTSKDAIIN